MARIASSGAIMGKTWRKSRQKNADETFKKPELAPKRAKQALWAQIHEESEDVHGYRNSVRRTSGSDGQ